MVTDNKINILLIEDEDFDVNRVRNTIKIFPDKLNIKNVVSSGVDALDILTSDTTGYDVIIMDFQIAGALRGEDLIRSIKNVDPSYQIIVITKLTINVSDFNFANRLIEAGAFWYCTKYPGDIEESIYQPTDFIMSIFNAYEKRLLELHSSKSNQKLKKNIEEILKRKTLVSVSETMRRLQQDIKKLAESDISTLVFGPSGTGKELVAYNIHYRSKRKFENFVPINCGSLPNDLIESELFGYEKGAFTGAGNKKEGLFELANNGTIFLDEVSELPLNAQVKLLRVLQEGEIEKIGRTKSIKVDVRVIAATNKNLEEEIKAKRFREDLYYRLNVVQISIKPLTERKDDIAQLTNHFFRLFTSEMGKPMPDVDENIYAALEKYNWPGNVRELKNVVQRLLFYSDGKITADSVKNAIFGRSEKSILDSTVDDLTMKDEIEPLKNVEREFRRRYIKFARDKSSSDADASNKLGIAPPNYHRLCKELGLK
ncbi:MAG: sigma-54-dependent Fis family transcriptional regulator [Melioribacteraceae bacterium]|nr:sigma-54-dependent Fis family transcriptional regulator [Melioribacteraceae bacterium]